MEPKLLEPQTKLSNAQIALQSYLRENNEKLGKSGLKIEELNGQTTQLLQWKIHYKDSDNEGHTLYLRFGLPKQNDKNATIGIKFSESLMKETTDGVSLKEFVTILKDTKSPNYKFVTNLLQVANANLPLDRLIIFAANNATDKEIIPQGFSKYFSAFPLLPEVEKNRLFLVRPLNNNFTSEYEFQVVRNIPDPVLRNQKINHEYHEINNELQRYLSGGNSSIDLLDWTTFGKHASYNAGREILELQRLKSIIVEIKSIPKDIPKFPNSVKKIPKSLQEVKDLERDIANLGLESVEKIVFKGKTLIESIEPLLENKEDVGQISTVARKLFKDQLEDKYIAFREDLRQLKKHPGLAKDPIFIRDIVIHYANLMSAIKKLPNDFEAKVDNALQSLSQANLDAYEGIAKAYIEFLTSASKSKNGIPENLQFSSEQYGFLKRAFDDYAEIRRISLSLKDLSPLEQKKQKAIQEALLLDANFAIAYYEQAFKIQPHYSKIKSEIDILNGQMSLIDPRGKFNLLRNFPTKAEDRKPEDSWTV
ncbi:MAG: hypothetical protein KBC84_06020, partial [Proteobacteria bacterium]|nr:hypothetical protein [Pseudomonadota bacterium]